MKYFVSGDIHGFYDEWQNALKDKGFNLDNSEHKIIFLKAFYIKQAMLWFLSLILC